MPEAYDFGYYIDSDGNRQYLFASANGWQMYQYDYGFDDNGSAIDASVRTKNYEFGEWMFEYIEIEGRKQEWDGIDLTAYVDNVEAGTGEVTDSNISIISSLSIGVSPIGVASLWGWSGSSDLQLYKFKVRMPFFTRGSRISLWLESSGVQWIFEKMTVKWEWETYEVFSYDNIL